MTTLKIVGLGLAFVVIFFSGYRLSSAGKPYGVLLLTVHKVIAVLAFLFLVVTMIQSRRVAPLSDLEWIAGLVSSLCFLSLVVSGGLLSANLKVPAVAPRLHHIAPYVTVLFTAITLYLLGS